MHTLIHTDGHIYRKHRCTWWACIPRLLTWRPRSLVPTELLFRTENWELEHASSHQMSRWFKRTLGSNCWINAGYADQIWQASKDYSGTGKVWHTFAILTHFDAKESKEWTESRQLFFTVIATASQIAAAIARWLSFRLLAIGGLHVGCLSKQNQAAKFRATKVYRFSPMQRADKWMWGDFTAASALCQGCRDLMAELY